MSYVLINGARKWLGIQSNVRYVYGTSRIGNRDVVGYGLNGSNSYFDKADFPFPAVRFKENTRDIVALRQKEVGDWRQLSCEEKKYLYRASFCQTFAEFQHPTGEWKGILGSVLVLVSFAFWAFMFNHFYVYEPLPASFSEEHRKTNLRRMLEMHVNPIDGLSSKWDYDNDKWKYARKWLGIQSNVRYVYGTSRIGNRDVVGYGLNGTNSYFDKADFPFPAVRFKENTRDIVALRQKEAGDWRQLCCEEKKALYRASFCQTFAEFQHPTGEWKGILGSVLVLTSFTFWAFMFNHYYVYDPLPASLALAPRKAQLRRMLELHVNPIDGLSSLWDYDKDMWKRDVKEVKKD